MSVQDTLKTLQQLQKQSSYLYEQLAQSYRIQGIWSEAFAGECKCAVRVTGVKYPEDSTIPPNLQFPAPFERFRKISKAKLRRSDDVEYEITKEELFSIFT